MSQPFLLPLVAIVKKKKQTSKAKKTKTISYIVNLCFKSFEVCFKAGHQKRTFGLAGYKSLPGF